MTCNEKLAEIASVISKKIARPVLYEAVALALKEEALELNTEYDELVEMHYQTAMAIKEGEAFIEAIKTATSF